MKIISCLIDFTDTSKIAIAYAVWLAKRENATVNLLHIIGDDNSDHKAVEQKLVDFTEIQTHEVPFTVSIGDGNYLKKIPKLVQLSDSDFVVIGTHGTKGIFQTLFGANVVKLVQDLPVSALVVQDNTPIPVPEISNILFPVAPHHDFSTKIEETAHWADLHKAQVDIFCLFRGGDDTLPENIQNNLESAVDYFTERSVRFKKILRESKVYSVGYAKDILLYSEEKHFDLISIMAQNSDENAYFGNVDKTNLILNPKGIPVLCINK